MKRYVALAEDIAQSIRTGVLKLGDRLPSVRQASRSRSVSPSTVFEAYYLLEGRGLIRARERSGYFVIAGSKVLPPEPEFASDAEGDSTSVDVSRLVFDILESTRTHYVVPFGPHLPVPCCFPYQNSRAQWHLLYTKWTYGARSMT